MIAKKNVETPWLYAGDYYDHTAQTKAPGFMPGVLKTMRHNQNLPAPCRGLKNHQYRERLRPL
jgi:hypothetical protein